MGYNIPYFRATLIATGGLVSYWRKYHADSIGVNFTGDSRWYATPASPRSDVTKSWEYWFSGSFKVPSNHPSSGPAYTFFNQHNSSRDVGNTGGGGIGWGFGIGVSAIRMIYVPSSDEWKLAVEPASPNNEFLLQTINRATLYDYIVQVIWGRLDQQLGLAGPGVSGGGIGSHPNNGYGRVRVWVNGSNTPLDTGNINTLQRSKNPDNGTTYTQTLIDGPWDGWYTPTLSSGSPSVEVSATRVGTSFGEMIVDGQSTAFTMLSESTSDGGSQTGSGTTLTPIDSDDFRVPTSLGGEPPPVVPPTTTSNYSPWSVAEQWNASTGVTDPPPDVPPTVVEGNIGQWSTAAAWNAYGWLTPAPDPTAVTLTAPSASVVTLTAKTPITVTITPVS